MTKTTRSCEIFEDVKVIPKKIDSEKVDDEVKPSESTTMGLMRNHPRRTV